MRTQTSERLTFCRPSWRQNFSIDFSILFIRFIHVYRLQLHALVVMNTRRRTKDPGTKVQDFSGGLGSIFSKEDICLKWGEGQRGRRRGVLERERSFLVWRFRTLSVVRAKFFNKGWCGGPSFGSCSHGRSYSLNNYNDMKYGHCETTFLAVDAVRWWSVLR